MIAEGRIAAALFGSAETSGVGRFQLLNRLGAGGMGVVYAAYDPQLDRDRRGEAASRGASGATATARSPRAKALARLSHPNVVPVYDVGVVGRARLHRDGAGARGGRWRVGEAARTRARDRRGYRRRARRSPPRTRRARPSRLQARQRDRRRRRPRARHRLRPRAARRAIRPPADAAEARAGTPRYMAPEQAEGGEITAAADQYGFCARSRRR